MNMKFSKKTVAVALLSLGMVGSASAGTFGAPVERSTSFSVTQETRLQHTLEPDANDLHSGNIPSGTLLAHGTIAITPNDFQFPMRIKDSEAQTPAKGFAVKTGDTTKKISIKMEPGANAGTVVENGWLRVVTTGTQPSMTYKILTDGDANSLDAGNYQITTEATTWTP
ncbi:hypothetical protein [Serratia sp. AKBS12]|uniref:hypothetical protein n=1 Tax=Serratia sp. AKBS12 TaxID=2974597 RepID=UPI002166845E|nr:hypothetical protein [Serratia sp. AKBS12]MCS3407092.1 hypothetical protein [Serratia sp. AKBS12]